jgi:hypothetical protein
MCGKRLIKQPNNKRNRDDDTIIQIKQRKRKEHNKVCLPSSVKTAYFGGEGT